MINGRGLQDASAIGKREYMVGEKRPIVTYELTAQGAHSCECGSEAPVQIISLRSKGKCEACGAEYIIAGIDHKTDEATGVVSTTWKVAKLETRRVGLAKGSVSHEVRRL